MAELRFSALKEVFNREPVRIETSSKVISKYFGEDVFNLHKMEHYLSKEAFRVVKRAVDEGKSLTWQEAEQVAIGLKAWALERGVTHFTHWFHPLTDGTAEKHDSFLEAGDGGHIVENFSGAVLVQSEPDASSFPSGGIRNTFEARGYTAWDVSSPVFIVGSTLCIPTIFVSYTGEALDYKAPLLKALSALDKAAVAVCQYFDKDVTKVIATLGVEQEYFLIDEALFYARPDLVLADRTLMGHQSSKDQQLADHYFSSIPERVMCFIQDFEYTAHKLGIPVKTRHNEVAPNQFECAPLFEEVNLAVDHNQLLMDIMKRTARKHKFRVLLHEKPFAGINGSGKHNNWSMATNTGKNLLSPGKNPKTNLQFLTFLVNVIKAVHDSNELIRASVMNESNSWRLGGHEAPPAIISVFLGSYLLSILDDLSKKVTDRKMTPAQKTELKLGIGKIPEILLDNTDRNRTSPFAFTGNRFEFRAVGSSANCSAAMIALNSAVAYQLTKFKEEVDQIIKKGRNKDEAIFQVLKKYILESENVLFEGDNYSKEWHAEAARRKLCNIAGVPDSVKCYLTEGSRKVLVGSGIFTNKELESRVEVEYEKFTKKVQIEARVLGDLAINHIVPTAIKYMTSLIENVKGLKEVFPDDEFENLAGSRKELIVTLSDHINEIRRLVHDMVEERKKANVIEDEYKKAIAYEKKVKPYLDEIREHIDKLELIVDDEMWPLPKYRELLFTR
ncbi:MAG: glutamine synthetase type III [Bacteroidales bacterium]|jgi:glutamine synthetase|nr:glutamine synthetase type III [Bacteroidales bacterium]NMD02911.1 glutamine synthetase type III [Bacteroidales bacterium]OQB59418.1 MAG: Glutamine synthetase [Bacteroidetes bacterium ADurb.Bin145]HOU03478.1 glutamine synthetase III [Bacteroidales bacterium]